jgi:hypothetical protein
MRDPKSRPVDYWGKISNVKKELRQFMGGRPLRVMPRLGALEQAGRKDLLRAIRRWGGSRALARRLGIKVKSRHPKPSGYWNRGNNFERELQTFIQEHGQPGVMPSSALLIRSGRDDLKGAIDFRGGFKAVARQLGLNPASNQKPAGYWHSLKNLETELQAFIQKHGPPGIMPTTPMLDAQKCYTLVWAINKHGGFWEVARKLGLSPDLNPKPPNYWTLKNLKRELFAFIRRRRRPGVMPIGAQLQRAQRADLLAAIQKHGGLRAAAKRFGLRLSVNYHPSGYWYNAKNVERELRTFIRRQGTPGIMPRPAHLIKARCLSLRQAIYRVGGFETLAKRLRLKSSPAVRRGRRLPRV